MPPSRRSIADGFPEATANSSSAVAARIATRSTLLTTSKGSGRNNVLTAQNPEEVEDVRADDIPHGEIGLAAYYTDPKTYYLFTCGRPSSKADSAAQLIRLAGGKRKVLAFLHQAVSYIIFCPV